MTEGQVRLFRLRTITLRDALADALSALEYARLSIVTDEVKRETALAIHKIQRRLDDDARRYSGLC